MLSKKIGDMSIGDPISPYVETADQVPRLPREWGRLPGVQILD